MKGKMKSHPNKHQFRGTLTRLDEPSDKSPSGARGHRIILTSDAAADALSTLIGMSVHFSPASHDYRSKIGIIEKAEICGNEFLVSGYIFKRDLPDVIQQINASADGWGMSYELADAHVEDMRADIWKLTQVTFTGAAILKKTAAAYKATNFVLVADSEE